MDKTTVHTMLYCSAIKVNELLMHTTMIWVNLNTLDCTKKDRHKREHCIITVIWNSRADMVSGAGVGGMDRKWI